MYVGYVWIRRDGYVGALSRGDWMDSLGRSG